MFVVPVNGADSGAGVGIVVSIGDIGVPCLTRQCLYLTVVVRVHHTCSCCAGARAHCTGMPNV